MAFPHQQQTKATGPNSIDIATADSRDCIVCEGAGLVTVYAPGYRGDALAWKIPGVPYVARTMAHCRCQLGRFLRACASEDVRRRTPDVLDIVAGRSTWLLDDPTEEIK